MKKATRKVGEIATPKIHPQLRGEIKEIKTFLGQTVYKIRGGLYTEEDLEPIEGEK